MITMTSPIESFSANHFGLRRGRIMSSLTEMTISGDFLTNDSSLAVLGYGAVDACQAKAICLLARTVIASGETAIERMKTHKNLLNKHVFQRNF